MSTVPTPTLGPNGYVAPPIADVLQATLDDLNTAFGGGLNASFPAALSTPQGQLATTLAAAIGDKNDLFLYFVNQVDPLYAQGVMQDALCYLYFLLRIPATATSGPATCTGLPGTYIAPGSKAKDTAGNLYFCVDGGTIPVGGSVDLVFAGTVTGPIACPAGTLTQIYVAQPGWSGITNADDFTLGQDVESSQAFELRRQASVAANATSSVDAIHAAVAASGQSLAPPVVPSSVLVVDNPSAATVTVGGLHLNPHSVYVATIGGDPASIAQAIWTKKSLGCDYWLGANTTVLVNDPVNPGAPSYQVSYEAAEGVPLYVAVTLKSSVLLPPYATLLAAIRAAIVALWAPPNNAYGQIGATLYASDLYPAVIGAANGVQIMALTIGTTPFPNSTVVDVDIAHYVAMNQTLAVNITLTVIP